MLGIILHFQTKQNIYNYLINLRRSLEKLLGVMCCLECFLRYSLIINHRNTFIPRYKYKNTPHFFKFLFKILQFIHDALGPLVRWPLFKT